MRQVHAEVAERAAIRTALGLGRLALVATGLAGSAQAWAWGRGTGLGASCAPYREECREILHKVSGGDADIFFLQITLGPVVFWITAAHIYERWFR